MVHCPVRRWALHSPRSEEPEKPVARGSRFALAMRIAAVSSDEDTDVSAEESQRQNAQRAWKHRTLGPSGSETQRKQ